MLCYIMLHQLRFDQSYSTHFQNMTDQFLFKKTSDKLFASYLFFCAVFKQDNRRLQISSAVHSLLLGILADLRR